MLSILISVAVSQAATATPAPPVQNGPVEVVAPQQPRRICRIERDTGSHMGGRRICQTAQEREQARDQTQRDVAENNAREWDRREIERMNQERPGSWMPNGVTGVGAGPR